MAAADDGDVAVTFGGEASPLPPCVKVTPLLHSPVEGVALKGLHCHFLSEGDSLTGSDALARAH
ncbi:hypothetical protein FG93_00414 [Bosea sp. LC85]|nr:hypothetical protein FG93_00414 [Bosea sp. LC85]